MQSDRLRHGIFAALMAGSLIAAVGVAPCARAADAGADVLQVQQSARNRAIAAHDAELLGSLFADDVSFNSHILHRQGRPDVLATWSGLWTRRRDLAMHFEPHRTRINPTMDVAAESGKWTEQWAEPDGQVTLSGTYLTVWNRDRSGAWRIAAETIAPLQCKGGAYCRR